MKKKIRYMISSCLMPVLFYGQNLVISASGLEGVEVEKGKITVDVSKSGAASDVKSFPDFWNKVFQISRYIVTGLTGLGAIALVGIFVYKAVTLANSGSNPRHREEAIRGIIFTFIGAALLGGVSLISGLAFGLFG